MSTDKGHAINWVATRKVDGEIEYLISNAPTWSPNKIFAKVFDTKSEARKYVKDCGEKSTIRKHT
tara:strand:- start:751 stop:945 length:195 start_codon:yes stop_codon:yes gene_type:complete